MISPVYQRAFLNFWRFTMGTSSRTYLLSSDDSVYFLPGPRYRAMLRSPRDNPTPLFAGQRIRCVEIHVETLDRKGMWMCGINPYLLEFDSQGVLNADGLIKVGLAKQDLAGQKLVVGSSSAQAKQALVVASRWEPSAELIALLHDVALGKAPARRL